ncbi:hypothetical protein [Luteimonas mephitis]|uniref:hypothetical protein n=1 Tax=Luteimonas mephitis TaxID=83615 RepID=UPI0004222FA6|nr:hypothetical protein [Luteimonas mephitis]
MKPRPAWALAAVALSIVVAGCASRSASVDHRMLLPEAGARHELAPTQLFVMPVTLAAPEPAFPAGADAGVPVEVVVCAEVWLSADGDVTRVAPFDGTPDCAAGTQPRSLAYAQSVAEALRRWEFTPAMICEFPPQSLDKRERGDCTGPEVTVRRVPVRLDYAFTFNSRNGRKRVGVVRRPQPVPALQDAAAH